MLCSQTVSCGYVLQVGVVSSVVCCSCPNMVVQVANEDEHDTDVEIEIANVVSK